MAGRQRGTLGGIFFERMSLHFTMEVTGGQGMLWNASPRVATDVQKDATEPQTILLEKEP